MLVTAFTFLLLFDFIPDFSKYDTFEVRKEKFIEYVLPKIVSVNDTLAEKRHRLKILYKTYQTKGDLHYRDKVWVIDTAEEYGIKNPSIDDAETWKEVFLRVDIIPVSLVIAQAATESGWGTSRFAQLGNNLFGHQCYAEGCGIVPKSRKDGLIHEVKTYPSVKKSIESYAHNINSNNVYEEFRRLRHAEKENKIFSLDLVETLDKYSELGEEYAEIIKKVIILNDLQKFDR